MDNTQQHNDDRLDEISRMAQDPDGFIRLHGNVRDESWLDMKEVKLVKVDGKFYIVSYEYVNMGELCYMPYIDEYCPAKLFINDMHAYTPSVNYGWKVMAMPEEIGLGAMLSNMLHDPKSFREQGRKVVIAPISNEKLDVIVEAGGECKVAMDGDKMVMKEYEGKKMAVIYMAS